MGQLLALQKMLLNLQFTVAAGEPVTRDRMLAWIEEAAADKGANPAFLLMFLCGGEGGIRTPSAPVESVTYRF